MLQATAQLLDKLSTAGGDAPSYAARSWVNFDGLTSANVSGTYSQTGTTVTGTITNHGLLVGHRIYVDITSGTGVDGVYTIVSVPTVNTFTYIAGTSLTTSGNISLLRRLIRAAGNVAFIAYNGVGDYTINFSTALPDANYAWFGSAKSDGAITNGSVLMDDDATISNLQNSLFLRIRTRGSGGSAYDSDIVTVTTIR